MPRQIDEHIKIIREYFYANYENVLADSVTPYLEFPYITPGSEQYAGSLWDWDSFWTDVGLKQIVTGENYRGEHSEGDIVAHEKGSVLNFLKHTDTRVGWVPINIQRSFPPSKPEGYLDMNMHKPTLAQHAALIVKYSGDEDIGWLCRNDYLYKLQSFINGYINRYRHSCGLYFWQNDKGVGVDNDPCSFDRPPRSCGSIFLNCFLYKELEALLYLLEIAGLDEVAQNYREEKENLRRAILHYCWDERDGFYYSVDFNLVDRSRDSTHHSGYKRDYPCLLQRIGVWSGFLPMWAGIATEEQAERMVKGHFQDENSFNAPYGIRTLSRYEKMYSIRASRNPSCWLGPVWGVSNYLVFRGLVNYGFESEAAELAEKTIKLFGGDIRRSGTVHEYYQPGNGVPICNEDFLNWNLLCMNVIAWHEKQNVVVEY